MKRNLSGKIILALSWVFVLIWAITASGQEETGQGVVEENGSLSSGAAVMEEGVAGAPIIPIVKKPKDPRIQ